MVDDDCYLVKNLRNGAESRVNIWHLRPVSPLELLAQQAD